MKRMLATPPVQCLMSLMAVLFLTAAASAQDFGDDDAFGQLGEPSKASLIADVQAVAPGQKITLGLHMEIADQWHIYWKNPEGPGNPVAVEQWDKPEKVEISDIQWPVPKHFVSDGFDQFGYGHDVTLLFDVQLPNDLQPGNQLELTAKVTWQACKSGQCIPFEEDLSISLPIQAEPGDTSEQSSLIQAAREKLPRTPAGWEISASPTNKGYNLKVVAPRDWSESDLEGLYFLSAEQYVVDPAVAQKPSIDGNTLTLPLTRRTVDWLDSEIERDEPVAQLEGVLKNKNGFGEDGPAGLAIDVPIKGEAPPPPPVESSALLLILGAAFLGGLILNLMPCVFPVLSIKILGFVKQSGEQPAIVRRHGYAFGIGVLLSFWVLAGVLLALRGAAAAAGSGDTFSWGFQMQNPTFVLGMILLLFLIGLNLAGVFEIGVGMTAVAGKATAGSDGYTKSFLSGVLATLIATPCTAPFMAGALGAALAMPAFQAMLVFTALGIGMATPYVVLSCVPMLLKYLPKPGPWMESFKQAMSFPMFATAAWLIWVYVGITDDDMVVRLLIGLTVVALGAWIYGRWSTPMRPAKVRWIGRGLAAVFAVAGVAYVALWEPGQKWEPFSPQRVEELRAEGRPVLIDFTARWCVSCQANKKSSLRTSSSEKLYEKYDVAVVEADYTSYDPVIGRTLTEYGREGVPLYLMFPADGGEPEVLPNILTPEIVADAVKRAAGDEQGRQASR